MALVGGLVVVLPDDREGAFSVASDNGLLSAAPADDEPPSSPSSTFEVSPSAPEPSVPGVDGDVGTAELALATEAALVGAEHSLANGLAILTIADEMEQIRAAAEAATTTVTEAPTTTAAPTTAAPVTTAPATSAADTEPAPSASTTEPPATSEPTTADSEAPPETVTADEEPTSTEPPTTEPPTTEPPTTEPPATTAPPTTAGGSGWVDTGNGVLVPPVLLAIRYCESTDNYTAANPSSSARGGYQFLTGSWAAYGHKDRYGVSQAHLASPAQQDEAALITWQRDGTRPWNASKSCWSKRI